MIALVEGWTQALARHFHQPETTDLADLNPGPIDTERIAQSVFDLSLALGVLHVDEVDHDESAKVAQAHLTCDFISRFQIRTQCGFLDVGTFGGPRRIDVDRNQGLSMVNHHCATGGQGDETRVSRLDLVFDLKARKERGIFPVAFDAVDLTGHDMGHELARLLIDVVGVDQNLADIRSEVVADRSNDQAGFLINQVRAITRFAGFFNGSP